MFSQLEHLDKYKSTAKAGLRCQQERCENCCSLNTKDQIRATESPQNKARRDGAPQQIPDRAGNASRDTTLNDCLS